MPFALSSYQTLSPNETFLSVSPGVSGFVGSLATRPASKFGLSRYVEPVTTTSLTSVLPFSFASESTVSST